MSTFLALSFFLNASAQPGTLDPTFNTSVTPGYTKTDVVTGGYDYGQAMAAHSDGRIVVAAYNVNNYFTILRYTSTGALDNTFGTGGIVTLRYAAGDDAQAYAVTVLSNNKILVAGYSWGATKDFALLQLNEDGTPDAGFGTGGWTITAVGAGDDEVRSMSVQPDGKIVLAGITDNGSDNDFAVVRLNTDGTPDNLFGSGGKVTTDINSNDLVEGLAVQSDGKIVVGGTSNSLGDADFAAVRYNSDGTPDNLFGTAGISTIDIGFAGAGSTDIGHSLAIQSDGKIILAGQTAASTGGNDDVAIIRLTANGSLDTGFDSDGILLYNYGTVNTDDEVRSVIVQSDGKILLGGSTDGTGSSFALMLLRFNADGSLDPTFGPASDGVATADITGTPDIGYAMAMHGTRIYLVGSTADNALRKQVILAAFNNNYSTLPLSLLQFFAEKQIGKVMLGWQTAAEENVKQFIVERSNDGKNFSAIGHVFAINKGSITNNYWYADELPNSNNYYRLLIEDFDGKYKYSKIVVAHLTADLSFKVQVFPNPVKEVLQVQLPAGLSGTIGLQIIDMNGRIVQRSNIASNGNALSTSLDIGNLSNGIYLVEARAGSTLLTNRFIKE